MTTRLLQAGLPAAVCLLLLSVAAPAVAARSALSLDPAIGPPTSVVKAKGSGFGAGEVVALFFDGARVGSDVASRTGKFNARLPVPASARPGDHTVEAVGQSSGITARAVFLVRTDWLQGCFDGGRSCFKPYENVLGPGNAGALALAWRAPSGPTARPRRCRRTASCSWAPRTAWSGSIPRPARSSSTTARGR